jgi:hypothetical protein
VTVPWAREQPHPEKVIEEEEPKPVPAAEVAPEHV